MEAPPIFYMSGLCVNQACGDGLKNSGVMLLREYNQPASMDLRKLWSLIKADLAKARNALPPDAASDKARVEYQDFLDHNELELACDMLEWYAKDMKLTEEFWLALRDAASKMGLQDRARQYQKCAESLSENVD
jgi:hypothetical protein